MTTHSLSKIIFLLYSLITSIFVSGSLQAQSAGDYRTVATGDWEDILNWERYDGMGWVPATTAPTYTDNVITIRSMDVITNTGFILADQLVIASGGTLNLSNSGTLLDGAGVDLTINGTFNLTSILNGPATCSIEINGTGILNWSDNILPFDTQVKSGGVINITNNSTKTLYHTLTIDAGGVLNLNYDGGLSLSNATIDNSGTINNSGDVNLTISAGTNLIKNNASGNFNKLSGTVSSIIGIPFNNIGTLTVSSTEKLESSSTFTNTGTINVNAGATFEISGGTFNHNIGTFNVVGTLTTSAGVFNHNSVINYSGSATLNAGGTYNLNADQTFGMNTVNITGTMTVFAMKTLTWSSGNISFDMGTLNNNGIINNSFNGNILNASSGSIFNSGTYTKSAGGGISRIEVDFTNNGTVNINSGTLQFDGTLLNNASKTINVNSGASFKNTGLVTDNGIINVTGGNIVSGGVFLQNQPISFTGSCSFTIDDSHNIISNQTFGAGLTVAINMGASLLNEAGKTLTWSGGVIGINNGTFLNDGIIDNNFAGMLINSGTTFSIFNNTGTFNKTTGTTTLNVKTTNSGTFNINSGTLSTRTFDHNNGSINVAGSTLESAGTFTQNAPINFTSSANFVVKSTHTINVNQNFDNSTSVDISGGKLINASGKIVNWASGTISMAASGEFENNGTFDNTFDGTINNGSGSNKFSNKGIFKKSAGGGTTAIHVPFLSTGSPTISGNGTLDFTSASSFLGDVSPGLSPGNLTINGTTNPLNSTTTLRIELDPSGTFDVLQRNSALTLGGSLIVTGSIPNGTYSVVSASSISGTFGSVTLPPGGEYTVQYTANTVNIVRQPLPVELTTFRGEARKAENILTWETASEINADEFIVERAGRADEKLFHEIGRVDAKGNTYSYSSYDFMDEQPLPLSYYRLKIMDNDGSYEYSKIIALQNGEIVSPQIKLYPVPAHNSVTFEFESAKSEEVQVYILDINGKLVRQLIVESSKGFNRQVINIGDLPFGMYNARISGADFEQTLRVIKN